MSQISYLSNATTLPGVTNSSDSKDETGSFSGGKDLSEQKQMFLSILLTQLNNQNPLSPVDTTEFTNQLVSYSALEQQMEINEKMDNVVEAVKNATNLSSLGYLGSIVDVSGNAASTINNEAKWSYALEKDAKNMTIQLSDASGTVIASFSPGESKAGTYEFAFDGADINQELPDGTPLFLSVIAVDDQGGNINTKLKGTMKVTQVATSNGETTLYSGSHSFPAASIITMRQNAA